jgi:hypothetical protein
MGDKSPKSINKAQKQKDTDKANAVQKNKSEQDAKRVNLDKAKK